MSSKKKSAIDLNAIARYLGVGSGPSVQAKRSLPRGRLKPVFWNAQFSAVVERLESWGYEVELKPGAADRVELGEAKTIVMNSSSHPETRFYTLLHELGHVLIRRRWKKFSALHPRYLDHPDTSVDPRRERSKAYRVGLVHEELEAWAEGLKFAQEAGLFVDPIKFDSDKNDALLSYIWWAGEVSNVQYQAARTAARTKVQRSSGTSKPRPRTKK